MGRVLTFADPAVVRMAREQFVSVAGDDWYQRRRQDDEGEFFRKVSNQGPRRSEDGSTRQGIYILTADGKLLAYRNHEDPEVMRGVIAEGLAKWQRLPASQRRPGALRVEEPRKVDNTYHRASPKGGLVITTYTRILDRTTKGEFCHGSCKFTGGEKSARDHLWLTESEWRSLIPENSKVGDTMLVPDRLVYRIARFHLVDNTRGEPDTWSCKELRQGGMKLTVEGVSSKEMTLRLDGRLVLATHADTGRAERGFDVRLLGRIHYDTDKKVIDRFDAVAVGEHWGEGQYTGGARPGRTPLGIAFELARGASAADQVPPQGARWLQGYIEAEK